MLSDSHGMKLLCSFYVSGMLFIHYCSERGSPPGLAQGCILLITKLSCSNCPWQPSYSFNHFRSLVTIQAQSLRKATVIFDRGALFGLFGSLLLNVFKSSLFSGPGRTVVRQTGPCCWRVP